MKLFTRSRPQCFAVALLAASTLSSCVTENPYTGEQQVSNTATGAGLGAAGGAILGAIIGNNVGDGDAGRGALIGAAGTSATKSSLPSACSLIALSVCAVV